jgi:DNA repair protein radc
MQHYHGHRQRLKDRLKDSPEKLGEYEVLELLLGYVILRRDTKPIAKELLERHNSLRGILDAKPEDLMGIPGIGPGVIDFMHVLQEVMARYAESRIQAKNELCSPEAVAAMARQRLGKLAHEEVWVAFVDNRNRLISWEKFAKGSVNASSVHPRDILEKALAHKASGFIIVHNHPGGDPSPSDSDLIFTQQVEKAARTLFIRFLDHVIVCDTEAYSITANRRL